MIFMNDPLSLLGAINAFSVNNAAALPTGVPYLFTAAMSSSTSVVNISTNVAEVLYGCQANITDPTLKAATQTLAAQCAAVASTNGWTGEGRDLTRWPAIIAAMRRDLGETAPTGQSWPDPSTDPAPLAMWVPTS